MLIVTWVCWNFPPFILLPRYTQAISSAKDVIILLDTSGSMTGFARDVAMATVTQILESLSTNDFFNIMLVGSSVYNYSHMIFNWSKLDACDLI